MTSRIDKKMSCMNTTAVLAVQRSFPRAVNTACSGGGEKESGLQMAKLQAALQNLVKLV